MGRHPRFSPDGRWLMYGTYTDRDQDVRFSNKLFILPLSGGAPTQIAAGSTMQFSPLWSPDGSRILLQSQNHDDWTAWVYSVDKKDRRRNYDLQLGSTLIDQWVAGPSRLLTWTRVVDAFVINALPVSVDGTRVTGLPEKLASITDQPNRLSASLNGRIVLSVSTSKAHIWGLPVDAKDHASGEPKQITEGFENESSPALSRDGGKMAFLSLRANSIRLSYKDLVTGRVNELSRDEGYWMPVFDRDGTGIMAGHDASLYRLPLSGGLPMKVWDKDGTFGTSPLTAKLSC